MKIKSLTESPLFGFSKFQNSGGGGAVTAPVILNGDPTLQLQATTKRYIDTGVTNIPAERVSSGILPVNKFPAFTGHIVKGDAASNIDLTITGITAGTYTKFDVNNNGRVVGTNSLVEADIPSLSWSKLTSGKPTNRSGYGITDAANKAGDTLTNFLTITNNPTANLHASNKSYADSKAGSVSKHKTGDVMIRANISTPAGFLRCNGGEVSKTTYSALYAIVGDVNNVISQPGAGQPWKHQYDINNIQDNSITGWSTQGGFSYYPGNKTAIILKNKISVLYVNNNESMGYSANINSDGTLTSWVLNGNIMPPAGSRLNCSLLVIKNKLHLIGGYNNGVGARVETYTATINADGSIGTWVQGPSLPTGVHSGIALLTKDRVYLFGGSGTTNVYTSIVNSDGTLAGWTNAGSFPINAVGHYGTIVKNRIYITGGGNATNANNKSNIYTTTINTDGSINSWSVYGELPEISNDGEFYVVKKRIYCFIAHNGSSRSTSVYSAPINGDGTLGKWVASGALNIALANLCILSSATKLYLIGNNGSSYYCLQANITGSVNDYAPYYNGTVVPTNSSNFKLPDLSSKEIGGMYYFIKQ